MKLGDDVIFVKKAFGKPIKLTVKHVTPDGAIRVGKRFIRNSRHENMLFRIADGQTHYRCLINGYAVIPFDKKVFSAFRKDFKLIRS